MRRALVRFCLVLCLLAAVFPLGVSAQEETGTGEIGQELDAIGFGKLGDYLPEETKEALRDAGLGEALEGSISLTPDMVLRAVGQALQDQIHEPLQALAGVGAVVVLAALLDGLGSMPSSQGIRPIFGVTASLAVCGSIAAPVIGCITETAQAIRTCADFLLGFIPVFAGVLVAGGQAVTATTYHLFLFSLCQVISRVSATVLVPLLGVYLAFCLTAAAVPQMRLATLASAIRTAVGWALGLMLTIFVAFLTVQTLVSSSGDSVSLRTAKFLIGSFVPVVGSALADAFIAAQGCIRLVRTTVGAFGAVAVIFVFLPVLLRALAWFLAVQLAGALAQLFGLEGTAGLLRSVGSVLGILMALILSFGLLVIISTTLVLLTGQGGT